MDTWVYVSVCVMTGSRVAWQLTSCCWPARFSCNPCFIRFEECLIKYRFAERVPAFTYELDGPDGKKITITATLRLLPGMAERILNYDETPLFSNKTCTRRQKNLKSDRIKAGAASKTKEGQAHGTLNAGTTMPDTRDGGRAKSMPQQVC